MTKHYGLILTLLVVTACTPDPEEPPPIVIPDLDITIHDNLTYFWYRDAALTDLIIPAALDVDCPPDQFVCGTVSTKWDYVCTTLPDTMWGIIKSTIFAPETLACLSGTCQSPAATYTIKNYLSSLLCD